MTKKRNLAIASITALGVAALIPVAAVSAQALGMGSDNFASSLATKLGVDEAAVETALSELKEEHQAERQAERQAAIAEAVSNGTLTDRQAEILEVMHSIREEGNLGRAGLAEMKYELKDMSEDEREAYREEMRAEKQEAILTELNEQGLNVSAEELSELHETIRELKLGGFGKGPGGRHPGRF